MAAKVTYIYRVELGHNDIVDEIKYCYARNSNIVKQALREYCRQKKYNSIRTIAFGDADIKKHSGIYEELYEDEIRYLIEHNIGNEEAYSYRKDNTIPANGEFVSVEKAGEVL